MDFVNSWKPDPKGWLCDSIYLLDLEKAELVDREKISDCWRLGVGGRVEYKGQNEGIFGIERIVLYHCGDVVMVMDI